MAPVEDGRDAYRLLLGMSEGKSPLGRPSPRWNDNIKVDLQEVGWGGRDWIELPGAGDRWPALVNAATNLRFFKKMWGVY